MTSSNGSRTYVVTGAASGIAEPVVVAQALAFLSSPAAQSITGQTLFVDGGGDCVVRGDDVF